MDRQEQKHPPAVRPVDLSSFSQASRHLAPQVDAARVDTCLRSFHRLSGSGPSGLKPLHVQDVANTSSRDELLEHLTSLVNIVARGDAPPSLAPYLAGAGLTALPKKDDDIRPVAVGETLRRLTAKCLCAEYKEDACKCFFPPQTGVGLALGTEIGVEVARQWRRRNQNNLSSVFVKIDFSNAFNCVDRTAFLSECRHNFPGLSHWAEWCYSQPSHLTFGRNKLSSQSGVQQGDPLGPFLFALTLQPLLREVAGSQLIFSYLDDLSLAGNQTEVSEAFTAPRTAAREDGLVFDASKCEAFP